MLLKKVRVQGARRRRRAFSASLPFTMAIVTVSRLEACRGEEVAAEAARHLGFRLLDRTLMQELLYSYDLLATIGRLDRPRPPNSPGQPDEEERTIRAATEGIIWHLAFRENLFLLGFGGQFLFRDCPGTLHVRLTAALEFRLATAEAQGERRSIAALQRREQERRRRVRRHFGEDLSRGEHYDLALRVDTFGVKAAAALIEQAAAALDFTKAGHFEEIRACALARGAREIPLDPLPTEPARVRFANESEAEFAKVLDFYRIPWKYEPETFPVEWWPDGRVKSSFSPDFYLTEMDTFLELTTMKQSLVTKKNRKVRLFRERYPDKKLLIFYGRDFKKLAQKFGLE
ncbi:MAG: cytidylate kinase family protein [Candidatus Methylomirabilia bacterium]